MARAADPAWILPSTIDYSALFRGNWSTCYLVSQSGQIKTSSSAELRGALSLVLGVCGFELFSDICSPDLYQARSRHCGVLNALCSCGPVWVLCVDTNLFSIRPRQRLGNNPAALFLIYFLFIYLNKRPNSFQLECALFLYERFHYYCSWATLIMQASSISNRVCK